MPANDTYILFQLDAALYGIPSAEVQHIDMIEHVTPVPNTAPAVDGVVFSRGQVVPAINLRVRFGMTREAYTPRTRLIFLRVKDRVVALIVDSAREFRHLDAQSVKPVDHALLGLAGRFVTGVATVQQRSVLLLNLDAVLTLEEVTVPPSAPAVPST